MLRAVNAFSFGVKRRFSTSLKTYDPLRVAVIGQSLFGSEVYKGLRKDGHEIVGVFTVPDASGKPDPLAQAAVEGGTTLFKFPRWREKKMAIPAVIDAYMSVNADVNVLPFCSQFIPMEVIEHPKHKSIIYHPSLLPLHRGASAINWTLISGDRKAGFSVFWADDGLDTGPLLLQRECLVQPNDTVDTLYNRFLFPEGIVAMREAVQLISEGKAPCVQQSEEGASYDSILKKNNVKIDWSQSASTVHNFIRGNDKVPGAWAVINDQKTTLFGSQLWFGHIPSGLKVTVEGCDRSGIVHSDGLLLFCSDGKAVNVKQVQLESGKMMAAKKLGQEGEQADTTIQLTAEDIALKTKLHDIWCGILNLSDIADDLDFFQAGAGSMDVVRLVEEVKLNCEVPLESDHVYAATVFNDLLTSVVLLKRGVNIGQEEFSYTPMKLRANNMDLEFPNQLFVNGQFVDALAKKTFKTINPNDESVICDVSLGEKEDVDIAVAHAKMAFYDGEWGKMNARDRGKLMHRLADLMEEHQEELATLESLDSGAVYTLALKTHVGMSIDTLRYFAGWCDKLHGLTIPINHARPNKNLTYTKREPLGVCGIITPWNYPLMMLAWKISPCLAAGNTVVVKPAQVTPLTALKFCELSAKAGFPPGVINVVPGAGSRAGQSIADHPDIRKLGFTGSTPIGKTIMSSCANSNLKKVSLELGGKSPLIIFSDCNLTKAVRMGCNSVFFNKGENCIAAGRLFVEDKIHDKFVELVIDEVKKMKIGDPLDRSTDHGPQNHKAHFDKLLEYIDEGVKEGATLVYGGKKVDRPGYFLEPTIFTDVQDDNYIAKEESFGPIMIISKFNANDIEGLLHRANDTEFGLASGVFTQDISKAMLISDGLEAGTCFINTYNKTDVAAPFGGFKQSGFGKDLGAEALNEYLKTKSITVEY